MMLAASILLVVLALFGAPLFAIIAAGALLGFYVEEIDLAVVPIEIQRLADMPVLIAIPLFTLAGFIMAESQAPRRLVRLTEAVMGWLPGGLPIVTICACALFTAFTGASGITIVALGALLYPALQQAQYPDRFSLGLITSSGSLGILFAPSLPLILYAVVVQQLQIDIPVRIDDLFLAGLLPGLLMLVLLSGWGMLQDRNLDKPKHVFSWREARAALRDSAWGLPFPIVVLGGIYSGLFAISEAATITLLYVLLVSVLIRREVPLRKLASLLRETAMMVGAILIILSLSLASTNYMIDTDATQILFESVREHIDSKLTFLILLNIFLLILGTMLDIFSAIMIVVPLIVPIAISYGIHPVHLGIIFLANMQIGYFTPPIGMNLFIASYRFDKPIMELYRATVPFFFILLGAVLVITYWPDLSLVLLD